MSADKVVLQAEDTLQQEMAAVEATLRHETCSGDVIIVNGRAHSAAAWLAQVGIVKDSMAAAYLMPYQKHLIEASVRQAEAERQRVQQRVIPGMTRRDSIKHEQRLNKAFTPEQIDWNEKVEARKQAKKARKQK